MKRDKWAPDAIVGYMKNHDYFNRDGFEPITTLTVYNAIRYHIINVRLEDTRRMKYKTEYKYHKNDLPSHKHHAIVHKDIELYDSKYKANIVISKYLNTKDPWIIVTNKDVKHAIQNYSHRFGSIECVFKNQKSNGLFLEAINNASEKAYNTMYTMACTVALFLTIIGADYSKNIKCYKTEKIVTHKVYKNKGKVRVMSLFRIGLTLFHRAVNSLKYIRLPIRFILYDI